MTIMPRMGTCLYCGHDHEAFRYHMPAPQWRTIDTAPKDRTKALFFTANGIMRVDGFHATQPVERDEQNKYPRWREVPADRYTHWMPLPAPPPTKD
jgi:hypothetical protein